MFLIFVSLFLSSIYLLSLGLIGNKILFKENIATNNDYYENGLLGIVFASIIAFLLNFFFSLNKFLNDALFVLPFAIIYLSKIKYEINFTKLLKFALICSLLGTIIISYDNVYRPDAGSYHLPFISILNENKIIIGLSNLHFRFGHISIMQYLSASFNNHLFNEKGILIPHALIFSFFLMFLINKIFYEKDKFIIILIFCFLSFVIFRMNRYSSFGNDAPAHFYYMYLLILSIYLLNKNQSYVSSTNKIILISIFIFLNKITMLLALFFPFIFLFNKNFLKILFNKIFVLLAFVFLLWIGKNILTSGCMAFPIEQTCIKNLSWFDKSDTRRSNAKSGRIENEAWTKGFPNQSEKNFSEFISSNEWIKVWKENHGIKILKKVGPFLIFMLIFFTTLIITERKFKNFSKRNFNMKIFIFLILNLIGCIMWFLKFPVFRYGYGYIISSFGILFSILLISFIDINLVKLKKYFRFLVLILLIGLASKNFIRIYKEYGSSYSPWPSIYTDQKLDKNYELNPIYSKNEIIFYKPLQSMCYYTKYTPCTHLVDIEFKSDELVYTKVNGYKIYFFKDEKI